MARRKASSAAYQRERKATLRGVDRARVLQVARELMLINRKAGKHYPRRFELALKDHA